MDSSSSLSGSRTNMEKEAVSKKESAAAENNDVETTVMAAAPQPIKVSTFFFNDLIYDINFF